MQAQSFVGCVRELESRVDSILNQNRLDPTDVCWVGLELCSLLETVDALIVAGTPLPVPETPTNPYDSTVVHLLEKLYSEGTLELSKLDSDIQLEAGQTVRLATVESFVQIPLGSQDGSQHNWRPLFRLLVNRFGEIERKIKRILVRTQNDSVDGPDSRVWQSLVDTTGEVRSLLKVQLARQERLLRLYSRPEENPTQFAAWTIERLTDTPTGL